MFHHSMMQQTRFFRSMSTMDSALFTVMGRQISIRQTAVLGLGAGIVLLLALREENFLIVPLIIIPFIFGFARTKTMTADEYIMSILSFHLGGGSTKRIKAKRVATATRKVPSMRLGLRKEEVKKVEKTETIIKIPVIDKFKPIRLNLTILGVDGTQYANQFVTVYLDDERVGAVSTDGTGQMAVTVVPGKIGTRKLRVMPRNGDTPLLDGVVEFVDE